MAHSVWTMSGTASTAYYHNCHGDAPLWHRGFVLWGARLAPLKDHCPKVNTSQISTLSVKSVLANNGSCNANSSHNWAVALRIVQCLCKHWSDVCNENYLQQLLVSFTCCQGIGGSKGFQYTGLTDLAWHASGQLSVTASSTRQCHHQPGSCWAWSVYHAAAVDWVAAVLLSFCLWSTNKHKLLNVQIQLWTLLNMTCSILCESQSRWSQDKATLSSLDDCSKIRTSSIEWHLPWPQCSLSKVQYRLPLATSL